MSGDTSDEFPGLRACAGGAANWAHNPDYCRINKVSVENGKLSIKASAGGYERGISIRIDMDLPFLISQMQNVLQSHLESELKINTDRQMRVNAEISRRAILWLNCSISLIGLASTPERKLAENGIKTVTDLCSKKVSEIRAIRGFGEESFRTMSRWLDARGLKLRDEEEKI